ncbi:hypothetical protein RQM47_14765 [Rubrivirga sp. S365]|uniref:DUF1641 domain-containing protein n=1 Tax=Rubrivirga litoralis TaxID=3075598 RepID=A0ABU3BRD6_9BACT|nr:MULTISPECIES: hypothetical protein [unclassified Rubrivirga]MDT0631852.1 hypothetical protein [Rubrivirga sp. F394]MDT7857905.1 hypothetical protein [Rubrivirga sp. S365]
MDTIPNETEAAEVSALVDSLEGGLLQIPLAKAINRIDDWRRKVTETEREDLQPIAAGLGELHQSLVGEGVDGVRIGSILVRLGEQTEEAAGNVAPATTGDTNEDLVKGLQRLGSLLRHAGAAMTGAPSSTTNDL